MKVVVGVSGGIAAYKAVAVVRGLVLAGHDVHVVPTAAALRFVGRATLEAISRNPVETDLWDGVAEVRHVALGQTADVVVIAPATANTLAKLAAGIADDLLGTTVLASRAPLVVAPAMHTEMWQHPATRANARVLESRGVRFVGPASGPLTGHDSGPGRMAEPAEIIAAALDAAIAANADVDGEPVRPLAGRKAVVSAGGTREPVDPVRFLGNASSGRFGVALAQAARDLGAEVVLVAAHLEVPPPDGVRVVPVSTAAQLASAMAVESRDARLVVMAAAVADYRVADPSAAKLKKADLGPSPVLELVQNPDILAELAAHPVPGRTVVGFAAETLPDEDQRVAAGRAKLEAKGADFLVLNEVGAGAGFGDVPTAVVVLARGGAVVARARGDKLSVASAIVQAVLPDTVRPA